MGFSQKISKNEISDLYETTTGIIFNDNKYFDFEGDTSFIYILRKSNSKVKKALKIFSLSDDFSEKILKKRYKELVKKYHPDLNRNFLNKDSKIKEINNAYNFLLQLAKDNHEIK